MSRDDSTALSHSLVVMDRIRSRVFAAGSLAMVLAFGAYFWLDYIARTTTDLKRILMAAVLAVTSMIGVCTFSLAVFVLRMTQRILRAIELTAAGSAER